MAAFSPADLSGNGLGSLEAEQVSDFSMAFRDDAVVTALRLERCGVGDRSIAWLRSAIMSNNNLTEVSLSQNEIGDGGASGLALLLERKANLTALHLESNHIGSKGAARLATALKKNHTIKDLDLRLNNIGDDGAVRISEALRAATSSSALATLNLTGNPIGDRGVREVVACFQEMMVLQTSKLEALFIGDRNLTRSGAAITVHDPQLQRFVVTCSASGTSVQGA